MRSRLILSCAFVFLCSLLFSTFLSAEPACPIRLKDNLFSVDFVDARQGWAVGYYGCIMHTSDGGKSWSSQACESTDPFTSVDFVDALNGWAVGYGPTIMHTTDGGKTWSKQKIDEEVYFITSVHFANARKGWATAEWGTILYTDDGGATWAAQLSGDDAVLYDLDFGDELNGWAVGEFGVIFHTADGGQSWAKQESGVENVFFSCQALDGQQAWAVGIDSIALHTGDGGLTWEKVDTGIKRVLPFYNVNFQDPAHGTICGQGLVVSTADGGGSWQAGTFARHINYVWLYGLARTHHSEQATLWMVGERGRVFCSTDYGKRWDEITYESR